MTIDAAVVADLQELFGRVQELEVQMETKQTKQGTILTTKRKIDGEVFEMPNQVAYHIDRLTYECKQVKLDLNCLQRSLR